MILGLFFAFVFLLVIIPYALELDYRRDAQDDDLRIVFWISSLAIPVHIAVIRWLGDRITAQGSLGESSYEEPSNTVTGSLHLVDLFQLIQSPWVRKGLEAAKRGLVLFREIDRLRVEFAYSLGDPVLTATTAGVVWSVLGSLLGVLHNNCVFFHRPTIDVTPLFGNPSMRLRFHCIFKVRLGHIILTGVKNWFHKLVTHNGKRGVHVE